MKTKGFRMMQCALAICLALTFVCGVAQPVGAATKGYGFTYNKVTVRPGDDAAKFIKSAGTYDSMKKQNSCATKGEDFTYAYEDFTLVTTTNDKKKNAKQYVTSITLKTKDVKTQEGIAIGSKEKDVKKKYKGAKSKFGVYTKTKGKTKICITVDGGVVSEIQILKK